MQPGMQGIPRLDRSLKALVSAKQVEQRWQAALGHVRHPRHKFCRQTSKHLTHLWIEIQQLSVGASLNVKHLQAGDRHFCSFSLVQHVHADVQLGSSAPRRAT